MAKDAASKLNIGQNVQATIEGKVLTIVVNLEADHGSTPKGFRRIATTNGNAKLPGGESVGLNVYAPRA
jgi:hypothetical protein